MFGPYSRQCRDGGQRLKGEFKALRFYSENEFIGKFLLKSRQKHRSFPENKLGIGFSSGLVFLTEFYKILLKSHFIVDFIC